MDEILTKLGLKFEDLSKAERDTLNTWLNALSKNTLSIEGIKGYIRSMRDGVESELTTVSNNSKQDLLLKARLRNYMLLEAFLTSPEKAKKQLELAISGIKSAKT